MAWNPFYRGNETLYTLEDLPLGTLLESLDNPEEVFGTVIAHHQVADGPSIEVNWHDGLPNVTIPLSILRNPKVQSKG